MLFNTDIRGSQSEVRGVWEYRVCAGSLNYRRVLLKGIEKIVFIGLNCFLRY
jgi:hypothetical protein